MTRLVHSEMKNVKMMDLTGLSMVAVDMAPTHAVCSAIATKICQR